MEAGERHCCATGPHTEMTAARGEVLGRKAAAFCRHRQRHVDDWQASARRVRLETTTPCHAPDFLSPAPDAAGHLRRASRPQQRSHGVGDDPVPEGHGGGGAGPGMRCDCPGASRGPRRVPGPLAQPVRPGSAFQSHGSLAGWAGLRLRDAVSMFVVFVSVGAVGIERGLFVDPGTWPTSRRWRSIRRTRRIMLNF